MIIYLISFLEALSGGLVGVNTALYFKFNLGLSEGQSAGIFSGMGILGSLLILLLGRAVDYYGVKRTSLFGAATLILGRVGLYFTHSLNLALSLLVLMVIGSAIKGSSILVFLRQQGKSFKLDYVVFNLAYCLSGFIFDGCNKHYDYVFLLAGLITIFNLFVIFLLPKDVPIPQSGQKVSQYDYKVLKTILIYNTIMLPVSGIFAFMGTFIPKWALVAIGPDAPVGKLYGSLNPFIILIIVPIMAFIGYKRHISALYMAITGTLISSLAMFLILIPTTWFYSVIASIIIFTLGEAIWSPANMEVGAKLCPVGQEGRYLTISLIPRTLVGFFMQWLIGYEFIHNVYVTILPTSRLWIPFIHIGLFALITPVCLILFRNQLKEAL